MFEDEDFCDIGGRIRKMLSFKKRTFLEEKT